MAEEGAVRLTPVLLDHLTDRILITDSAVDHRLDLGDLARIGGKDVVGKRINGQPPDPDPERRVHEDLPIVRLVALGGFRS